MLDLKQAPGRTNQESLATCTSLKSRPSESVPVLQAGINWTVYDKNKTQTYHSQLLYKQIE